MDWFLSFCLSVFLSIFLSVCLSFCSFFLSVSISAVLFFCVCMVQCFEERNSPLYLLSILLFQALLFKLHSCRRTQFFSISCVFVEVFLSCHFWRPVLFWKYIKKSSDKKKKTEKNRGLCYLFSQMIWVDINFCGCPLCVWMHVVFVSLQACCHGFFFCLCLCSSAFLRTFSL